MLPGEQLVIIPDMGYELHDHAPKCENSDLGSMGGPVRIFGEVPCDQPPTGVSLS
jgi:hypothetical protein